jgi:hypothetical protein
MVTQFSGPAFGRFQQNLPLLVKECSPEDFLTINNPRRRNLSLPMGYFIYGLDDMNGFLFTDKLSDIDLRPK